MAQAIKRKDFLVLTVTFGTFGGAVTACGDDDASTTWEGGAGKPGGGANHGGAGSNHAGSAGAGGSSASNGGGLPGGGQAGNDAGPGGAPASAGAAGEGGTAGEGHGGQGGSGEESSAGNAGQAAADGGNDAGGGGNGGAAGVGNSEVSGGESGLGGAGGAAAASSCAGAHMMQTSVNDHTHITPAGEKILTSLLNGSNPTAPFQLPPGAGGHSHTIELTPTEVDALLAGFSVTGKVSSLNGHTHTYTISCG